MLSLLYWPKVITLIDFYCITKIILCHFIFVSAASFMNDHLIVKIRYRNNLWTTLINLLRRNLKYFTILEFSLVKLYYLIVKNI